MTEAGAGKGGEGEGRGGGKKIQSSLGGLWSLCLGRE